MASILVVEDDADTLEMLCRMVERAGHTPIRAANGWEALVALDERHVDLLLLDLMMPGMNGHTFLRILRHDERRRLLPVILITALRQGDMFYGCLNLGVGACLIKGEYGAQDLFRAIEQQLAVPPGRTQWIGHAPSGPPVNN
jgi:CheY-like chemotaxis protein